MNGDFTIDEPSLREAPAFALHPVHGVVWAAFFGSPVAAGIILAQNYSRMGKKTAARITVVVAVIVTAALFAVIFAIPEDVNIPNASFYVPQLILVYAIANTLQGHHIRSHARQGGIVSSAWWSVGVGLLCLPLVLAAVFGVALLLEPSFGTVIEFGNDEVYYAGEATEDDARKLARALQDIESFGSGRASVRLESSSGRNTVSFVLVESAWDDPETVDAFRDIGRHLVESGFPTPLTIQLCDDEFALHETLTIR